MQRILMQHVNEGGIDVHVRPGSIRVVAAALPSWAAACIASMAAEGDSALSKRSRAILAKSFAGVDFAHPLVLLDGSIHARRNQSEGVFGPAKKRGLPTMTVDDGPDAKRPKAVAAAPESPTRSQDLPPNARDLISSPRTGLGK